MKKDNAGFRDKIALRRRASAYLHDGLMLETYGGRGLLYDELFRDRYPEGVVFDIDRDKAAYLARRRPAWCVYESDPVKALAGGLHADERFVFVDVDPHGACWPAIFAVLGRRLLADGAVVCVNCGLRRNLKYGVSWQRAYLDEVSEVGDLYAHYMEACRKLIEKRAARAGYGVDRFEGFYAGYQKQMTHFYAVLKRSPEAGMA